MDQNETVSSTEDGVQVGVAGHRVPRRTSWFSVRRPFKTIVGLGLYLSYNDGVAVFAQVGPLMVTVGPHYPAPR